MLELALGLTLFFAAHLFSAFRSRDPASELPRRIGPSAYRGTYSLIAAAGLAGIVYGFAETRTASPIYPAPSWAHASATVLMLPALILIVATYLPAGHLKQKLRHPMLIGVGVWAFAHLLTGANLPRLLLFGAFLAYSVIDFAAASMRDQGKGITHPRPSLLYDFYATGIGAAAYCAILFWLHRAVIGIDLLPG